MISEKSKIVISCAILVLSAVTSLPSHATSFSRSEVQKIVLQEAMNSIVPPALALAVAKVESDFNANALSSAGARGVMQIMPRTARDEFGVYEDEEGVHVDASNVIPSTVVVDPTTNPFGDLKLQQFQQQVQPISMETKRDSFWDIIVHALNVMENLLHE